MDGLVLCVDVVSPYDCGIVLLCWLVCVGWLGWGGGLKVA